jgi:hypothetical protein
MHSDTSLPRTFPDFSRTRRLVPRSTLADSDGILVAPEAATEQSIRQRWRADASSACSCDAEPGWVLEFPHFEHGAGI